MACSSGTRVAWLGGYDGTSSYNTIDYVDPDMLSSATDFGDLTVLVRDGVGLSGD
jgi:hypothetical protein